MTDSLEIIFKIVVVGVLAWIIHTLIGFEDAQREIISSEIDRYFTNNEFIIYEED